MTKYTASDERQIVHRYESNPVVTVDMVPYECTKVYNAAACKFGDEYLLIVRADRPDGQQWLGLARSADGLSFTVEPEPLVTPGPKDGGHTSDPRCTPHEDGWYYITYQSDPSGEGMREEAIYQIISRTKDFRRVEEIYRSEPDNRDAVIFPEKVNGLYCRFDRPFRRGYRAEHGWDIWFSASPDLVFWGQHHMVLSIYDLRWGHHRLGAGAPPIKTEEGWLEIFHAAELPEEPNDWLPWRGSKGIKKVYYGGVMLLDLEEPWRITAIYRDPLMIPQTTYEMDASYRPNVIFPSGVIPEPDGQLKIYYGASDTSVALATANIDDLVRLCLDDGYAPGPYVI